MFAESSSRNKRPVRRFCVFVWWRKTDPGKREISKAWLNRPVLRRKGSRAEWHVGAGQCVSKGVIREVLETWLVHLSKDPGVSLWVWTGHRLKDGRTWSRKQERGLGGCRE